MMSNRIVFLISTAALLLGSLACALSATARNDLTTYEITVDGRERSYHVYVPATDGTALPVMLSLHGGGGDGPSTAGLTGFNSVADAEGFIVVYPDGFERSWADGRGVTNADDAGIDDIAFLQAVVDDLATRYTIDTEQIYATGISNGGYMSQTLACGWPDGIAGIGVVVANTRVDLPPECEFPDAIPVAFMLGRLDPLVPWQGGDTERGVILSGPDTIAAWAELMGCSRNPEVTQLPDLADDDTSIELATHSDCRDGVEVRLYEIRGGGHTWPGGAQYLPEAVIGRTSQDLEASPTLWDFLTTFSR
ncbi:MAG: prolyl oligopeptidase family serine peptidase [Chloroflexi bacterium]|nr:prolyl oligopeptidase family serine peptidase [Chloroflexota bacterium]